MLLSWGTCCTPESQESVIMATGSSGEIRRGFANFSGGPGDCVGWGTRQSSLCREDKLKLHKVLSGASGACPCRSRNWRYDDPDFRVPDGPGRSTGQERDDLHPTHSACYVRSRGLFQRGLTCRPGLRPDWIEIQRGRLRSLPRSGVNTQDRGGIPYPGAALYEQFISFAMVADQDFDPARVIQDMWRICTAAEHMKAFTFVPESSIRRAI